MGTLTSSQPVQLELSVPAHVHTGEMLLVVSYNSIAVTNGAFLLFSRTPTIIGTSGNSNVSFSHSGSRLFVEGDQADGSVPHMRVTPPLGAPTAC
eukprot:3665832-Prymnesium_polylepis.1